MKLKIKTTYPCVIKCGDQIVDLDTLDVLEIEDIDKIFVYPLQKVKIPFFIDINSQKRSIYYDIFQFETFSLVVLNSDNKLITIAREHIFDNGREVVISIYDDKVSFQTENLEVIDMLNEPFEKYKAFKLEGFACVLLDESCLYAFNIESEKLSKFSGKNITLDDKDILLEKIYDGFDKFEKTARYSLENGKITLKTEKVVCTSNSNNSGLCGVRFLEAIQSADFESAQKLLSPNLRAKTSSEKLQSFFGKIKNILPVTLSTFLLICEADKKYVQISSEGGLIGDISVDIL